MGSAVITLCFGAENRRSCGVGKGMVTRSVTSNWLRSAHLRGTHAGAVTPVRPFPLDRYYYAEIFAPFVAFT